MAHLTAPQVSLPTLPVFFDVDGVVGASPAQNKREDVLLVQFLLKTAGEGFAPGDPGDEFGKAVKAVRLTGTVDDATIQAIRVQQNLAKALNAQTIVDGRVSPSQGGYSYGAHFSIVHLNNIVQDLNLDVWPRIDKIPGFPMELKQLVTRTLAGT